MIWHTLEETRPKYLQYVVLRLKGHMAVVGWLHTTNQFLGWGGGPATSALDEGLILRWAYLDDVLKCTDDQDAFAQGKALRR